MIAFICLFFPAVLSVWIYEKLTKTDLKAKQWLYFYTAGNLFINLLCFVAKKILLGTAANPLYTLETDITPSAACNYLIMAIPAGVFLAVFAALLRRHIAITVEGDDDAAK